jgi:hypothetical protein
MRAFRTMTPLHFDRHATLFRRFARLLGADWH